MQILLGVKTAAYQECLCSNVGDPAKQLIRIFKLVITIRENRNVNTASQEVGGDHSTEDDEST